MIRIKQLILWSNKGDKKVVDFKLDGITVIIGDGKAGKSSIITIIDYCLGASGCDVPFGVIRESCSWFGLVIDADGKSVLIARKSHKENRVSNEMYFKILGDNNIPNHIEGNMKREEVKNYFNEQFQLSNLSLDSNRYTKEYIPSYRDTIGLNFYPQELLLDKSQYFYKQNIHPHGQNFKLMYPYMVGTKSMKDIINQRILDSINQKITMLEKISEKEMKIASEWETGSQMKVIKAIKLGLIKCDEIPENFDERIELLKRAMDSINEGRVNVSENSLSLLNRELMDIENNRSSLYQEIISINSKIKNILMQREKIDEFKKIKSIDSVKISKWLVEDMHTCVSARELEDSYAKEIFKQMVKTLQNEENNITFYESIRVSLDKEYIDLEEKSKQKISELKTLEESIRMYKKNDERYADASLKLKELYSFYGELENYIKIYEMVIDTSNIDEEIKNLEREKQIYESKLSVGSDDKEEQLELYMNGTLDTILETLNVEYKGEQVQFSNRDIAFKFALTSSGVSMSNIGSGSNFVQYHIVMALLLQIYIQNKVKNKCTFDFLIFDQPSEAYFPAEIDADKQERLEKTEIEKQNDIESLHALFSTIARTQRSHCANLQMIILEHADESYWKGTDGKYYTDKIKIINWKEENEKLIPESWIDKK